MRWFGMSGHKAYLRYTEGYNDLEGIMVPDFSSIEDLVRHTKANDELDGILEKESLLCVADWLDIYADLKT